MNFLLASQPARGASRSFGINPSWKKMLNRTPEDRLKSVKSLMNLCLAEYNFTTSLKKAEQLNVSTTTFKF
jgi:hypothetical protein